MANTFDHGDADEILRYRSQKFKRRFEDQYVNPYVNPRYKSLFKTFESIVEYVDFYVDTRENGDPIIIIGPIDKEKFMEKYRKSGILMDYGEKDLTENLDFVYKNGVEKMRSAVEVVKKQNMTHSGLVPLPYVE